MATIGEENCYLSDEAAVAVPPGGEQARRVPGGEPEIDANGAEAAPSR